METILITFFGAVFGGLFAALFKEQLSEIFFKKKRRTELRTALTKHIVLFFRNLKKKIDTTNSAEIHRHRKRLLEKLITTKTDLTDTQREQIKTEISGLFEYGKELVVADKSSFDELTLIESEIFSLAIECENYFKKHQYSQLRKCLLHIAKEGDMKVDGYQNLDYPELLKFQAEKYNSEISSIGWRIDEKNVNEILKD